MSDYTCSSVQRRFTLIFHFNKIIYIYFKILYFTPHNLIYLNPLTYFNVKINKYMLLV